MIKSSAKPITRNRLHQLVRGLKSRSNSSARQMAEEIDVIRGQQELAKERHKRAQSEKKQEFALQRDQQLTAWDEKLCSGWDKAEATVYAEVKGAASKTATLNKTAKSNRRMVETEAQRRTEAATKEYEEAAKKPTATAAKLKQHASGGGRMLTESLNTATSALLQRSLPVPDVEPTAPQNTDATFASSGDALRELKRIVDDAQAQCRKVTHQPLARFVESPLFWVIGMLLFGAVAATLVATKIQSLVPGVAIGGGVSIAYIAIGLIAGRPWLKRVSRTQIPLLHQAIADGKHAASKANELIENERSEAIAKLAAVRDKKINQVTDWKTQRLEEIETDRVTYLQQVEEQVSKAKSKWSVDLGSFLDKTNTNGRAEEKKANDDANQDLALMEQEFKNAQQRAEQDIVALQEGGVNRLRRATEKAVTIATNCQQFYAEQFTAWSEISEQNWPEELQTPILPLGKIPVRAVDIDTQDSGESAQVVETPLLFSPLNDKYLTILADPSANSTIELVRSLVLRFLTHLPAGKAETCVIDQPGLGRDFGWLMHLADYDPELVSHRVWTQEQHIGRQTSNLARGAEDFIQQALRNEYPDIAAYNQHAGALAEPFRLLVWSSFPDGLTDQSWKALQSLLDTGARCGVVPILVVDPNSPWLSTVDGKKVLQKGLRIRFDSESNAWQSIVDEEAIAFEPEVSPSEKQSQEIISQVGRRALQGSRVEVPLSKMVPQQDDWWQGDSSRSLEIPVGQSGVGRTHSVTLGLGTAQHAIIAGKTGSGKSSLLHALITSALVKYSPDRLRLVLLDFKKGVEFQVYSEAEIPHADIIGIESQREFGLSALEYIDGCLNRRGEAFRQAGVQDLPSWNLMHPDDQKPRMLLVIDEFQELFVEDDRLGQQASLILDRIVRQGRSFGVHAVLSSQTLSGSYALPRTTLGQMAVRIALQCDAADANIIFTDDNPAAARLKHPGQAVYNDEGGRIEGNQPMQIGWLANAEQKQWLGEMENGYQNGDATTNALGRTVVFDGNRPATWDAANADLAIERSKAEENPDAIWCVAGESVAISPAVCFPLTNQPGRNVMLVGASDAQASATMTSIVASWSRQSGDKANAELFAVQGARPVDRHANQLPKLWEGTAGNVNVFDTRTAADAITQVHEKLKSRIDRDSGDEAESSGNDSTPILLTLLQLGRLRDLRSEDEFSFGESSLTPDKMLEEILRDGPAQGIHTVLWCDSASTLGRWLSRSMMREIEIRLLMQMSANDSTNLVESVTANRLGEQLMLAYDEASGIEQKFRPFRTDDLGQIIAWDAKDAD